MPARVAQILIFGILPSVLCRGASFCTDDPVTGDKRQNFQPFFEVRGGVIASAEPIPVDTAGASALNFLFDFGGGIQFRVRDDRTISFGYKFLHISNADTSAVNPGVDNNVFYAAFSLLR